VIVTRRSQLTGINHSLDLPVTQEQLDRYASGGELIQHVFPNLSADQREFLMTGITGDEWDAHIKDDEEEI
jgi:hypothetical protein